MRSEWLLGFTYTTGALPPSGNALQSETNELDLGSRVVLDGLVSTGPSQIGKFYGLKLKGELLTQSAQLLRTLTNPRPRALSLATPM